METTDIAPSPAGGAERRALRAAFFGAGVLFVAAVFAHNAAPPPLSFDIAETDADVAAVLTAAFQRQKLQAAGVTAPVDAGLETDASFQAVLMRHYAEARAVGDAPRAAALKQVALEAERFSNAATPQEREIAARAVEAALARLTGDAPPARTDAPALVPVNR